MKHMFGRAIITRNDILLLAAVLLAGGLLVFVLHFSEGDGSWVVVSRDGAETARYPLKEDAVIDLSDEEWGSNLLRIEDGEVWMESADCPDGLCMSQGRISRAGESIICLPHRLAISIEGEAE